MEGVATLLISLVIMSDGCQPECVAIALKVVGLLRPEITTGVLPKVGVDVVGGVLSVV